MALTNAQIARLALGALRAGGTVSVVNDDLDELEIYVDEGFDYLEEHYTYDPGQYAITSATLAVQYYILWRFTSMRPNLMNLTGYYEGLWEKAEKDWAGEAATQANLDFMEYPENRGRVAYNNADPLNQFTDPRDFDRYGLLE